MPLSKERNRKRMRLARLHKHLECPTVQPNDAPQSISSPLKEESNTNLPPEIDAEGYPIPDY